MIQSRSLGKELKTLDYQKQNLAGDKENDKSKIKHLILNKMKSAKNIVISSPKLQFIRDLFISKKKDKTFEKEKNVFNKPDKTNTLKKIKSSYYMKSLNFYFKLKNDDIFSIFYKDHFHKNWIDLRYKAKSIKFKKEEIEEKRIELKTNNKKKILILDLDETLISCTKNGRKKIEFFYKKKKITAYINIRPHLQEFLEYVSKNFELVLFSTSYKCYIDAVLKIIDPENKYFKTIIPKKYSIKVEQNCIKNLNILKNDLKNVLIVDNSPFSFICNLDNGIPIIPFIDNKEDIELMMLKSYLEYINLFDDVRKINRKYFKLYQYKKYDNLNSLFECLFS